MGDWVPFILLAGAAYALGCRSCSSQRRSTGPRQPSRSFATDLLGLLVGEHGHELAREPSARGPV